MQDINSLKLLSKKLTRSIEFVPNKVIILSNEWGSFTKELSFIEFKITSLVEHGFYVDVSKKMLHISWNYNSLNNDLKDFFKTLIRVLQFSGVLDILVLDKCFALSKMDVEVIAISDHINFTSTNPLIGRNDDEIGTRFPDMSHAYFDDYFGKFDFLNKVVLAGIEDLNISEATMRLIKQSDALVYNFSVMWMNILAVHSSMKFSAVCRIEVL